nr:hypothetical protein [Methylobacterium sp. BTF04]
MAACESSVDQQRATICRRLVPALAPADSTVRILRIGALRASDDLQVDYAVIGGGSRSARQRRVVCGFGPGAELLGVSTEQGPMNGAALYLLKRYYLDTPEAAADDPVTAAH